jgi:hypothetical protein
VCNKLDKAQQKCLEYVVSELRKISLREIELYDKAEHSLKWIRICNNQDLNNIALIILKIILK